MKHFLLIIFSILLGTVSCQRQDNSQPFEETRILMDTVVRISIYPQGMSEKKMSAVMDKAFRMIEAMEIKTSAYIDTSEVNQIGAESGRNSVLVSPDVVQLLNNSITVSDQSEGAFDVTIGAIKKLWGFDSDVPHIPDRSLLSSMLTNIDYKQIHIEDDQVMLNHEGMQIDLGGIAKGYIIDRAVDILRENGIRAAIVDGGGDLRIIGSHPSSETWRIGIRHPRSENGELYGVIKTGEASIATSGDYERFFIQDGVRYHHILDPKTGFPANGCVSVTIVSGSAVLADAFATAVFVLGPEKGMALIEHIPTIEGLIIYENEGRLQHVISDGLLQKIEFQ